MVGVKGISAADQTTLPALERKPKSHAVRLISENRIKGFVSEGQWSYV